MARWSPIARAPCQIFNALRKPRGGSQHDFSPECNVACTFVEQSESGVKVGIEDVDGKKEIIQPQYVIGADGVHSIVRKGAGLEMRGDAYADEKSGDDGYFTMSMMDVPLDGYPGDSSWVNYHFSAKDWMLITGLPDGNHRVYISGELEKEMMATDDHASVFQKGLDQFAPGTMLRYPQTATTWKIYKMIADDYRKDRVFLAGDACHVRSPAGGQGANCCMMDAFNLGWKLASVVKGKSPESILESYGIERKPIAQQVQSYAEMMHKVLFDHSRPLKDRIKDTEDPAWHDECVYGISGISHNYRSTTWVPEGIAALDDGPRPGERAPNALLCKTPLLRIHDVYRHPSATLLMIPLNDDEVVLCNNLIDSILNEYGASVKPAVISPTKIESIGIEHCFVNDQDELHRWYGQGSEGRMFLVRPDMYVGYASTLNEKMGLQQYLSHWFHKSLAGV